MSILEEKVQGTGKLRFIMGTKKDGKLFSEDILSLVMNGCQEWLQSMKKMQFVTVSRTRLRGRE
jgi:hypothetical protein